MKPKAAWARLFSLTPLLASLIAPVLAADATKTVTITAGSSKPSGSAELADDNLFTSAILNSTNTYRAEHSAPDVSYNATLAAFAAGYLAGDRDCLFNHRGGPYGENIAIGCSDARGCVQMWGDERDGYDFARPGFAEATGHFTQLVWKNTSAVGCGRRFCGGGDGGAKGDGKGKGWFLVCEYWPRGNVIGQFGDEVGARVSGAESVRAGGGPGLGAAAWVLLSALLFAL